MSIKTVECAAKEGRDSFAATAITPTLTRHNGGNSTVFTGSHILTAPQISVDTVSESCIIITDNLKMSINFSGIRILCAHKAVDRSERCPTAIVCSRLWQSQKAIAPFVLRRRTYGSILITMTKK